MSKLTSMYNVKEAAQKAGCTEQHIRQLLQQKKLNGQKVSERCWLIPKSDVTRLSKELTSRAIKYRVK